MRDVLTGHIFFPTSTLYFHREQDSPRLGAVVSRSVAVLASPSRARKLGSCIGELYPKPCFGVPERRSHMATTPSMVPPTMNSTKCLTRPYPHIMSPAFRYHGGPITSTHGHPTPRNAMRNVHVNRLCCEPSSNNTNSTDPTLNLLHGQSLVELCGHQMRGWQAVVQVCIAMRL